MGDFPEKINQDSWAFGAFLGTASPFLALFIIYYLFLFLSAIFNFRPFDIERFYLLSISVNLFLFRYYLVSSQQLKTGKSILAVTFLMIFLFFALNVHQ